MAVSQKYIALLRAINVGGHSIIKMADLRQLFESVKVTDVSTYIQTGNVLFESSKSVAELTRLLETKFKAKTGKDIQVFLLTPTQLKKAAIHNPFHPKKLGDDWHSHVMFLSSSPSAASRKKLLAVEGEDYRFAVRHDVLYYAYPKKYEGRTRRNVNFEKILEVRGTARNSKVVDKLSELANP